VKNISINGAGLKGINTDLAPWELPPEFITSGRNFRIEGNRIVSVGAYRTLATPSNDPNAGHIFPVHSDGGDFWLILGGGAGTFKAQSWDGSTFNDISSAAGAYAGITFPENWTSAMLGKIPIVNNNQHYPEYWDPQAATTLLQALKFDAANTFAAVNKQFKVIRSHQNYLFALNLIEGGIAQPNAYRWSHPAPVNNLPPSWDETDSAYIAGKAQVGGETGSLIDGRTIRDSFALYSEFGVTLLDASYDDLIWKPRPLSESYGVLNENCIQEVKGVHFFMSDGDILRNDGSTINSIVNNIILKRLRGQINSDYFYRSYSSRDTGKKEIWFCVPEGSAQYPNVAYVYSWIEGKWSIHDLPYAEDGAAAVTSDTIHARYGVIPVEQLRWSDFASGAGAPWEDRTWADIGLRWSGAAASPLNQQAVGVDNAGGGALIELDPTAATGQDTDFQIERTDITLEGANQICTIVRVYPYMDGSDPVEISIGSQKYAGGPITWEPAVIFDPSTDRKIDVRSTGALHCYRVSSIGSGKVSFTGMNVEYELDGRR
jgi:hypothetical protein